RLTGCTSTAPIHTLRPNAPSPRSRNPHQIIAMSNFAPRLSLFILIAAAQLNAQQSPASSILRWRNIGPLRGGRTKAIAGVPNAPYTFYMAQVNGGVWKTN